MANPTMTLIASNTVGSGGAGSVTFSSIPSTYTDLQILFSFRNTGGADYIGISFNGSSSSFSSKNIVYDGSTVGAGTRTDNLIVGTENTTSTTSNTFANSLIYIPNYASSNNKSFSVDTVIENTLLNLTAGLWSNSSAITSITLAAGVNSLAQYSTAYLYGINNS